MKPISIETYISSNNPNEVMRLLREMGSPKPKNFDDMVAKLHIATKRFGEKAFDRLSKIDSPYRSLIMSMNSEQKSGCDGCGGKCGGKMYGFDGRASELELDNTYAPSSQASVEPTVASSTPNTPIINVMPAASATQTESYLRLHPLATGVGVTLLTIGVMYAIVKSAK